MHIASKAFADVFPQKPVTSLFMSAAWPQRNSLARTTMPSMIALATVFLEFPIPVIERANLTSLEPTGDAVEMERVL